MGGELTGRIFSITGAVIGGLGLAIALLSLGAYFDSQDNKKKASALPPEMFDVFDRIRQATAKVEPQPRVRMPSTASNNKKSIFLATVSDLIGAQLIPKFSYPKYAFGALMTNKRAAGYVFGFHDALLQRLGLDDSANKDHPPVLIDTSYKDIFGNQAGYALFSMSLSSQHDTAFRQGRASGGADLIDYLDKDIPPLGLSRILVLNKHR